MTEKLEKLITYAIADGVITDKEREILMKNANEEGLDLDEFEMILNAKLHEKQTEISIQNKTIILPPPPLENPKSNKEGALKKCPSCGCPVPSFGLNCSECGHEFRNTEAVNFTKQLEIKLSKIKNSDFESIVYYLDAQKSIIMQEPLPNSKEDLFEAVTYMSGKVLGSSENSMLLDAYQSRALEAINKLLFMSEIPNDTKERLEKMKNEMTARKSKNGIKLTFLVIGILLMFAGMFYGISLFIRSFL